jgi:hypothetical protein
MDREQLLEAKKAALKQVVLVKRRLRVIGILLREMELEESDVNEVEGEERVESKDEEEEEEEEEEKEEEEPLRPPARKRRRVRK